MLRDSTFYEKDEKYGKSYQYKNGKLIFIIDYDHGREKICSTYFAETGILEKTTWFGTYAIDSSLEFYPNGNKKIFYENNRNILKETYVIWSQNKVPVLKLSYNEHRIVTDVEVRSEKNVVLKKNTADYNKQVLNYLPPEFSMNEKTGEILIKIIIDEEASTDPPIKLEPAKDNEIFSYAERMPEFPGGIQEFQNYIAKNLVYPQNEMETGKEGTVYVSFCVEKNGSITRVKVVKEVAAAPGFTTEAIRLISQMPNWTPGQMNGRAVAVSVTQPVRFKLQ